MITLTDNVDVLPGVGPKRLTALHDIDIFTIEDLIDYFPFRYEDLGERLPSETLDGDKVTFKGVVSTPPIVNRFGKRSQTRFGLLIDHENIRVSFFNQPWIAQNVEVGQEVAVYGTYDAAKAGLTGIKMIQASIDALSPIYPATKQISAKTIRHLIELAWSEVRGHADSLVPKGLRDKYRLLDRNTQIENMHFPSDADHAKSARRSAAFEEFFVFQMRLQLLKLADQNFAGESVIYNETALAAFENSLPFKLTPAQTKVIQEILQDQKRPRHMNRLLQGDVGSGKTVVAAMAMYAVITAGMQAAMMAPTEILAQQHAINLANMFDQAGLSVRVELLTSGLKAAQRRHLLEDLSNGDIDILVGTHALLQPDVAFHHLGLAVIDEQHRFGVNQRAKLRENGVNPDILAMTATPIPRTLAITAYGEMDVSVIDQLPAGRKIIQTRKISHSQLDQTLRFVRQELEDGAQVYVVTPLIEESEALDVQNAQAMYEAMQLEFPDSQVGLLHGRLSNDEKKSLMADFKANRIQILVATTVIEVGVDVPNASIMLIMDADRFGLAQLHQLRGRVGRGSRQSYAILVADPKTDYGRARLDAMVSTTDGFVLAQKDLELRGSGDILGTKQAGVPEFAVGDPVKDLTMMTIAQQEAIDLVSQKNWDDQPENKALVTYLSRTMARYRHFD
ncbi:ATP-dependent DNA helicase RecG [Leuconostoc falkenbergense]|uniref:ATP-dependent DNA helicase RecG n=1 Tax=Leuconostoc falkenbergense TaxID=2766470 RepID=UPI00027383F9|nr:ATP-dependent DNA helicase RecG [Leuconostoc falkenbergense]KDA48454.1 ATP-dependent DNA helicase RecG [Leuconostoc pseudomesenteroides 1159]OQJ69436.1 ATP-dependent DNA helicase RecG [Leuconostoc pseudomesenteroides]CCJ67315.1 ATP-dependent DNA helicase RecG [Leuconostoc pseudomesenteroides 4882]MCT4418964.1 ATP-dependent DNA helicase RecG [Leuconostoc falkenbergense]OQJ71421.1 ATP-dependent DNA helicase RecG [Leuconostoc pseudomesenteroides]